MERAFIVGVNLDGDSNFELSMDELASLAQVCEMEVVGRAEQNMEYANTATYIGAGKVEEVRQAAEYLEADIVIFDNALSPIQLRNLQRELDKPVMDRTTLILEIFSTRAKTREAKLQVELARLQYLLPRLSGMGTAMSRQGGGSGSRSNKGAGEKKLELDRRHISHRITECKKELQTIKKQRVTQRKSRNASQTPSVALVGYTNAGKSTILNAMLSHYGNDEITDISHKKVLQEDMLFATLETTVRKITIPGKPAFYLSDTVGFIDKLPHHLIDAFRSTLEEAIGADLLLQVVDVSDPYYREHMRVTQDTLNDLGAGDIPMLIVYNKADRLPQFAHDLPIVTGNHIHMAAGADLGMDALADLILSNLFGKPVTMELLIPYSQGSLVHRISEAGEVAKTEYQNDGTYMQVTFTPSVKDHALMQEVASYRIG